MYSQRPVFLFLPLRKTLTCAYQSGRPAVPRSLAPFTVLKLPAADPSISEDSMYSSRTLPLCNRSSSAAIPRDALDF